MALKEVTKEQFWTGVMSCKRNIHPTPTGNYPYTSIFKTLDTQQKEFGRIVPVVRPGMHRSFYDEHFYLEAEF